MNTYVEAHKAEFDGVVEHFRHDLKNLRIGRANPGMVEDILVEVYGVKTPIKQLGSIGVPEPRCLTIEPWDKNILKDIEKGLVQADLGVGIAGESTLVRVTVPAMTEENRKNIVKSLNEKLEEAKIALRGVREKVKEAIVNAEKNKEITQDDRYSYIEEMEKEVQNHVKTLQDLALAKEKEVMSI
jgi:ribosome recycling factor